MTEASAELTQKATLGEGATSGIGEAITDELANMGAMVIAHGRGFDRAESIIVGVRRAGGPARYANGDLTNPAVVHNLAREVGAVGTSANNAGCSWCGPTSHLPVGTLDDLFAANIQSSYLLVAALAPAMIGRGGGVVVDGASMAGAIGLIGGAVYSAAKDALKSLTRSWAAPRGDRARSR